ncbi:hypothetical protein F5B19DRAFT_492372 [Rostrohypoxylon terebratum]|nr:hypothetical protein F5B19DRAFT_492372 [Rostrohypoxylon terebratum]
MQPLVLLVLPLFALAAPSPQGQLESRSTPIKPNPPGSFVATGKDEETIGYSRLEDTMKAVGVDGKSEATCTDCSQLQDNIVNRHGIWHLTGQTNLHDDNDWIFLGSHGTCTLLVKNTAPTTVGTGDAAQYLSDVYVAACSKDGNAKYEARHQVTDPSGVRIDFFIRGTSGLDLSRVNH